MNEPHDYIESLLAVHEIHAEKGRKIWGDPRPVYRFLLEHGQEFQGTPWKAFRGSGWRRLKLHHCFRNSFVKAAELGLTYCEGYASTGGLSVHHAWCLDDQGRVVDFTWRESELKCDPSEWQYFGIPMDHWQAMELDTQKEFWSHLYSLPYSDPEKMKSILIDPEEKAA